MDVSCVIPCLDERATVAQVVTELLSVFTHLGLQGEVIVADNGCRDDSMAQAEAAGARCLQARGQRGPGYAVARAIDAAAASSIVMLDADGEHNPADLPRLLEELQQWPDALVVGARGYQPGAGSWLNRSLGTPALTKALNVRFGLNLKDCNSGFRALSRASWQQINIKKPGFEFCSEMLVNAARLGINIREVPITQRPGPPGRQSKLRRIRDGLAHLAVIVGS